MKDMPVWYGAVWALVGVGLILVGYRGMRLFARLASAVFLAAAGLLACAHFHLGPWASLGVAAALGVVGFLAGNAFYFFNVGLNGAAAGYVLAGTAAQALAGKAPPWVLILGMAAGALMAVLFERPLGIFGTSLVGAALLAGGLSTVLGAAGAGQPGWLYGALLIVATIAGCVFQARTTRDLPPRGGGREPERERP